ncbi:MAG: hypothetical protein IPJ88_08050 [Myxococcales bacterium]|nr:MAG: hypothetical protein IPJ88_08050 [Myxococcales bacterium]
MSNLKDLSTQRPETQQQSAAVKAGVPAGAASDDASGLIDIKALASAAGSTAAATQNRESSSSIADQVFFSAQNNIPLAPLAAPSLRAESSSELNNKTLLIALGVVGILALVAIVLVAVSMFTGSDDKQDTLASAPTAINSQAAATAQPTEQEAPQPAATVEQPAGKEDPSTEDNEKQASDEKQDKKKSSSHRTSKSRSSGKTSSKSNDTAETTTKKSSGSIDDLLDQAISGGSTSSASSKKTSSNLPNTPSRSDVVSALRAVEGSVKAVAQVKQESPKQPFV